MIASILSLALSLTSQAAAKEPVTFFEEFPDQATKLEMVKLPDGDGIKGLAISRYEVPWEVFEIWALRLDQSTEQQVSGKTEAIARPSRPYAVIFTGFGHHGYPANCISLASAKEFCKWLSAKTNKKYRLPTVAEWQYAAKGGSTENPPLDRVAWFWDNSEDTTHKIGSKPSNGFGLFDTLGNVSEWALDKDGNPVVCGGSWKDKTPDVGWNSVKPFSPKWNEADPQNPKSKWWLANGQFVGIRVVCTL